jgi:hypothetical protein
MINFRWHRWGSLLLGLCTLHRLLSPQFFNACIWARFFERRNSAISGDSKHFSFFLWVKTPWKISEHYDNPLWEKSNRIREREIERNKCSCSTQAPAVVFAQHLCRPITCSKIGYGGQTGTEKWLIGLLADTYETYWRNMMQLDTPWHSLTQLQTSPPTPQKSYPKFVFGWNPSIFVR